jgi:hypothetical protein
MDTSIFAFDLPAWLSWGSNVLYVASVGLALFVIFLVSCLAGQGVTTAHSGAHKRKSPLAH